MSTDLTTIFGELAEAPRWVAWKKVLRDDHETKVPTSPVTGGNASTTDPATWGTLEQACVFAEQTEAAGVGIVLGNGLGGVDLDACRNSETGEIAPWARKIIDGFATYTEVSPSGTGVKLYAYGAPDELPAHEVPISKSSVNGKRPQVEAYTVGRYFAVTGEILDGCPDEIRDCGEVGDGWDRMLRFLRKYATQERKPTVSAGTKIPRGTRDNTLTSLAGSMQRRGMSEAAILAALEAENAARCEPPLPQTDLKRITRSVSRYEPERRTASGKARRDGGSETKDDGEPRFIFRYDDEIERIERPPQLITGLFPQKGIVVLYGKPGHGKSLLALDWALSIETGTQWVGGRQVEQGHIIYVLAEGGESFGPRIEAWKGYQGAAGRIGVQFLTEAVNLMDPVTTYTFIQDLGTQSPEPPRLIVLDTLARCMAEFGGNENDTGDMSAFVAGMDRVKRETGAGVLTLHHPNATGERERGNTSLRGATDTMMEIKRVGTAGLVLTCSKQKDAPEFEPIHLELTPHLQSVILTAKKGLAVNGMALSAGETEALESLSASAMADGLTATAWREVSNATDRSFYRYVKSLCDKGLVVKHGEGRGARYSVPEAA